MRNAYFPHMEWAKAHTKTPLPIELGFSGAAHPPGKAHQEFGGGYPPLERRIARKYGVARECVYLAGGTSLANFVAIAAFCDPGDHVAVETPRYAPLSEVPRALGANVLDVARRPDGGLATLPVRASLAIVTTPHNPTGKLLLDDDWKALSLFCDAGGVVICDEVYRDLNTRPQAVAATRHPRMLTTGGFTKTYGLGGLRLGWVLGAPELIDCIRHVDNLVSVQCSTTSLQLAEKTWPRLPDLRKKAMRSIRENLATLAASGLNYIEPDAGLTALVHAGDGDAVSAALEEKGVGVARGSFFNAPEYVRVFLGAQPIAFRDGIAALSGLVA